jgi:DNA replication protein DnaC
MKASSDVAFLSRALKAPRIRAVATTLADRAREESWDYEAYLAAVLQEEVSSREGHGGENRVKAARFPQTKTLDDFDFSFQRSIKRSQIAHLKRPGFDGDSEPWKRRIHGPGEAPLIQAVPA